MISGTLADARRRQMTYGVIVISLLIAFAAFMITQSMIEHMPSKRSMPAPVILMMLAVLAGAVISLVLTRRRLITKFDYDGSTLYFQTLSRPEPQTRQMIELHKVTEWRGRGGLFGYILVFRDGQKLNVDLTMANGPQLIAQIQHDRWPTPPE